MENINKIRSFTIEQHDNMPKLSLLFVSIAPTLYASDIERSQLYQREILLKAKQMLKNSLSDEDSILLDEVTTQSADVVLSDVHFSNANNKKINMQQKPICVVYEDKREKKPDLPTQLIKRLNTAKNKDKSSQPVNQLANNTETKQPESKVKSVVDQKSEILEQKALSGKNEIHTKEVGNKSFKVGNTDSESLAKARFERPKPKISEESIKFLMQYEQNKKEKEKKQNKGKLKDAYSTNRRKPTTYPARIPKDIDEQIKVFTGKNDPLWQQVYRGSVLQVRNINKLSLISPRHIAQTRKVVVSEISHRDKYVVVKYFNQYRTIPFADIESVLLRPIRYIEQDVIDLRSMAGYYRSNKPHAKPSELSNYYVRWFVKNVLVADFLGSMPNINFSIEIKDESLFNERFKNLVKKLESYLKRCGIELSHYTLDSINTAEEKMAVIFSLVSEYIIDKDYFYSDLKTYLNQTLF